MGEAFRRIFCPAKVNLFLDVLGRRRDRYHDILSLVCQVNFGDYLRLTLQPDGKGPDFLSCDVPTVPCDFRNSVHRALELFRQIYDFPGRVAVKIVKNIPMQSGFGGGSSDAALFLWHLNELLARPLSFEQLCQVALAVGSDVPLFLHPSPAVIRGRGNIVEGLPDDKLLALKTVRLILFKPAFSISTARAYGNFVLDLIPEDVRRARSEAQMGQLIEGLGRNARQFPDCHNVFQGKVLTKFLELALIFRDVEREFGLQVYLTGTGSGCFIPVMGDLDTADVMAYLRATLGPQAFVVETTPRITDS